MSAWHHIGISIDQELLQNALSRMLDDKKFMAHTLQADHTREVETTTTRFR